MKKTLRIISALLIILLAFSACSQDGGSSESGGKATVKINRDLIAKWVLGRDYSNHGNRIPKEIEFFNDGTMIIASNSINGTFSTDGNSLKTTISAMEAYTYTFNVDGDELELKYTGSDINDETTYIYYKSGSEALEQDGQSGTDLAQASDLALSCDAILASGTEPNGDVYEMVLVKEETYFVNGKIGFIKNGKWIIEPTDDVVFYNDKYNLGSLKETFAQVTDVEWMFDYVGFGTFTNDQSFYNCETKQSVTVYNGTFVKGIYYLAASPSKNDSERRNVIMMIPESYDICIVDVINMTVNKTGETGVRGRLFGGLSDGLFSTATSSTWFVGQGRQELSNNLKFYDIQGNLVLDLSEYKIDLSRSDKGFQDGKYTFVAINSNENWFKVTVDKAGNVLSEEKLEG